MKGTRYRTDGRFDRQSVHRLPHPKGAVATTTATAPFLRSTEPKELLAGNKRGVGLSLPRVRFGNGVGGRTVLGATRLGSQVDIRISPVPIAGEGTLNACKRLDSTLGCILAEGGSDATPCSCMETVLHGLRANAYPALAPGRLAVSREGCVEGFAASPAAESEQWISRRVATILCDPTQDPTSRYLSS